MIVYALLTIAAILKDHHEENHPHPGLVSKACQQASPPPLTFPEHRCMLDIIEAALNAQDFGLQTVTPTLKGVTLKHEIWIEGYLTTGMEGNFQRAKRLAIVEAETFVEACNKLCSTSKFQDHYGTYHKESNTVWGCKLFNNEAEARRSFG